MKFFNTAGPVNRDKHYKIAPLTRWNMEEVLFLIQQEKYFILHAPRQTGKTSSLLALRDYLNAGDDFVCIYANFEAGQAARHNIASGIAAVLSHLHDRVCSVLGADFLDFDERDILDSTDPNEALGAYLARLCEAAGKPVVLLIDEIDSLVGDTLISVLRQIRSRYDSRPASFPQSVILCGVRDIKDYRIHRSDDDIITGGSCFNIKAESLAMDVFTETQVRTLYGEHTAETGQVFEEACYPLVMHYTGGQPWLVNALAHELTFKMQANRDRTVTITPTMVDEAKERLILSRATHLDQLADKLKEERVRRVVEPMLIGQLPESEDDDTSYCRDLGLIQKGTRGFEIANGIYREFIPRELTTRSQERLLLAFDPEWVNPDETINTETLFSMFQTFWRENSEIWKIDMAGYKEAAPHLTFQAFLQRVANGNGTILREYAYGTRRADLALKWQHPAGEQRIVIELKMLTERDTYDVLKQKALEQTAAYAQRCDATESHIIVFDRTGKTSWKEQVFTDSGTCNDIPIKIWGM